MKNSAVKALIVNQFNINTEEVEVQVEFLHSDKIRGYHFEVYWIDCEDVHHQVNITLPHIEVKERQL